MNAIGEWKKVQIQGEGTGLLRLEKIRGKYWIILYDQLSASDTVQEKAGVAVDALKENPEAAIEAALTAAGTAAFKAALGALTGASRSTMAHAKGPENEAAKEFSKTLSQSNYLALRKRLIFETELSKWPSLSHSGNTVSLQLYREYRLTFAAPSHAESFLGVMEHIRENVEESLRKQQIDWTLDANGQLIIRGNGAMPDWDDIAGMDTPWYASRASIKTVHIKYGFTSIGMNAFRYCNNLTAVVIPSSVASIGRNAFYECESLTSIVIPNSVTYIGDWAFERCKSLTSVAIPNSVTSIGLGVFEDCTSLRNIEIPNSVTSIGSSAFANCENLTSIHIPQGVTEIESSTFMGCKSLRYVFIPNSVTTIGLYAFSVCKSLPEVRIPNSVTSLSSAFDHCENLKKVHMPARFDGLFFKSRYGITKNIVTFY